MALGRAVPGETFMTSSLKRFGYVTLKAEKDNLLCCAGDTMTAHEFHYSDSTDNGHDLRLISREPAPLALHHANDHFIGGIPTSISWGKGLGRPLRRSLHPSKGRNS